MEHAVKATLREERHAAPLPEHDGSLLQRVQEGDLSALGVLYDRHFQAVLRFGRCLLQDKSEAEDVAQEVFITAARVASSFDGRPSSRAWLFGIAARLVLNRARRGARFLRFVQRLGTHASEAQIALPEETLLQSELRTELSEALHKLTPSKRVVIVLAEVEGLSGPEIAEALGIPVGTVWTRLHHARSALREQLRRKHP
jgi:RNA polymerase sigma factor (sigma-70 family)